MNLLNKAKELINMARPKILRPKTGGEITLKNVTDEDFEKIEAALNGVSPSQPEAPPSIPVENRSGNPGLNGSPLTSTGVGVYMDPLTLEWHVVTLKYSPVSRVGEVVADVVAGKDREMVRERFKIQVVKEGLL